MLEIVLNIITTAIILLIAIGLHEYAHAYVSYRLGDPTPKLQGRLTTNPIKHLDPIGFFCIFLIGFGRGKPVQVNPSYYKQPVKGEFMVAMAGPIMNLILAVLGILLILIITSISGIGLDAVLLGEYGFLSHFLRQFAMINIVLAIFNLIPLPPLDGFRIVKIISQKFAALVEKYTLWISIIFLVLILGPFQDVIGSFLNGTAYKVFKFIFMIFSNIFY